MGLFADSIGKMAYKWEGSERLEAGIYTGPDEGENNGHLEREEDDLERPEYLDYTLGNDMLDFGDGHPDFKGPPPPDVPYLRTINTPTDIVLADGSIFVVDEEFLTGNIVLQWNQKPSENSQDPFSREIDFEGYRIYVSNTFIEKQFAFLDQFDRIDYALFSEDDSLASKPVIDPEDLPETMTVGGVRLYRKPVGYNTGLHSCNQFIADTSGNYYYIIEDAHPMVPRYYSVTAFDYGDYKTGTEPLESARIANAVYVAPSGSAREAVRVVPNPYRANVDYTVQHGGISWENRDDGTSDFFPQTDRRLYFYNLPKHCLIRVFTVSGDLVAIIPHNVAGDKNLGWNADYAESWDLNSR
ncbi:MAG: hypothetical protein P9M15_07305, partial [Candidatus Electryoneaceae bacterium]|nr:hypothetical protein [Candidatus Electryoneaceae bacterium]